MQFYIRKRRYLRKFIARKFNLQNLFNTNISQSTLMCFRVSVYCMGIRTLNIRSKDTYIIPTIFPRETVGGGGGAAASAVLAFLTGLTPSVAVKQIEK